MEAAISANAALGRGATTNSVEEAQRESKGDSKATMVQAGGHEGGIKLEEDRIWKTIKPPELVNYQKIFSEP